jgi:branched-chain amino acid transport system substrate-binding protein
MEDKKVKKVIIVAMLISILLLGLTGIVSAQENIIKIGVSVSLTGRLAQPGRLLRDGFVIWEDWVNSHGGITAGGINYKVKMVYYDDESTPVRGAKLTEMLITQNKVDFLFGPLSSAITFATSAIGEKYKIITIAPNANATNIYERGYKYVFSLLPPATYALQPIAYMTENLDPKPKTVAMITVNDLFPLSCAEGFRDKAKELGLEIVLDEKYPAGATDISTLLTQVKALNPDILVSSGYPVDTIMILKECKELNINPKMYAFAQNFDYITLGQVGADAEYILEHV